MSKRRCMAIAILALQAFLLDPVVTDIDRARAILDDLLEEFTDYLPQFH